MVEEKGREWVVKGLMKSGATRVLTVGSKEVRDFIIKTRNQKGIKALKGVEPLQKYVIGAALQDVTAHDRKNMICIEVSKSTRGEGGGSIGMA
jgi:hypothetical protein